MCAYGGMFYMWLSVVFVYIVCVLCVGTYVCVHMHASHFPGKQA